MKQNTFILKCFLQFMYPNLNGSQKEGGNFLNLLQREGTQKRGGLQPWKKLWIFSSYQEEGKPLLTANVDRPLEYTQKVATQKAATSLP